MNKKRRDFIIKSGLAVLGALFLNVRAFGSQLSAGNFSGTVTHETVTFEHFYQLSLWVTYQADLDMKSAKYMYEVIKDEPWGAGHVAQVYNKLGGKIASEGEMVDIARLIEAGFFEHVESWFISHIAMTWYLGIYYHNERDTKLITHEGALMRKVIGDHIPTPYIENTPYGDWRNLPQHIKQ